MHDERPTRLRALADAARAELDPEARERVARRVGDHGPALVRRSRRIQQLTRAGAGVAVLGVLAALVSLQRSSSPDGGAVARQPALPKPNSAAPAPLAPAPPCAGRSELGAVTPGAGVAGAQRIALGPAGLVVADVGTTLWVDASDACRIRVRLREGRVSVRADDLGGGELRVATPHGDVRVHGTKFSVTHSADELVVDVDEGRVSVARDARALAPALTAGQRLRARHDQPEGVIEALPASARAALLDALAEPVQPAEPAAEPAPPATRAPRPEPAPRSVQALVDEAEALWRDGDRERARTRFRQAGAQSGPTAEAAWLALARRELALGRLDAAQAALDERAARFTTGALDGEALGIAFRVALQSGDQARIRRRAEQLYRAHPKTPQGESAARWLEAHPSR